MAGGAPAISYGGYNEPWIVPDYQDRNENDLLNNVLQFNPGEFFGNLLKGGGSGLQEGKKTPDGKNFFNYEATKIDGKKVKLAQLCRGKKAVLVVNVASK